MIIALIIGVLLGMGLYHLMYGQETPGSVPSLPTAAPITGTITGAAAIPEVVDRVGPAVVQVTRVARGLFGQQEEGIGSGFIVRSDGYIVTNRHVIEGLSTAAVTLANGKQLEARVLASDPRVDLAVLKVNQTNLPAAVLGNSDAVRVGETAIAIGSPLGLQKTVTVGVVSAKERNIPGSNLSNLIQTDAAINPGNSGGPLVNIHGEVIGINTVIAQAPGAGLGFAVPSNTASRVVQSVIQQGRVIIPWIGINYAPITNELASAYNLPVDHGIFVADVQTGSPAAAAGLQRGDIITHVNGKAIVSGTELQEAIGKSSVGSTITLRVVSDGQPRDIRVTVGEMPQNLQ
jgi:serine protease Do